jgi:hypothetical protein
MINFYPSSGNILTLILLVSLNTLNTNAQINETDARLIVKNHYIKYSKEKIENKDILPVLVYIDQKNDTVKYYAYNIGKNKGFVIVSANDIENPVIGYSFTGQFIIPDSASPPEYVDILKNNSRRKAPSDKVSQTDGKVISPEKPFEKDLTTKSNLEITSSVDPLIQTKWGQGQYYNDSIPEYKGSKMPVGCVATALSQIMKYYNYPPIGSGSNSYESPYYDYKVKADFGNTKYRWELMPNEISGKNSYIAQLCYHVGVAVVTDYDPSGSAADSWLTGEALRKNFNFSERLRIFSTTYCENNGFSWKDSLKNEINQKRPVLMEGDNPDLGGHDFICDGYQDEYFHFNFGWNGSADGYYYLNDIHGFNEGKRFTTNLQPPVVTFAISNMDPEVNEIVSLHIISKENADQCQWTFSSPADVEFVNGTNTNSINPQVVFKNPGDYYVHLNAIIQGEWYHIIKSVQVTFIRKTTFNNAVVTTCFQSVPIKWFDFDNDGDLDLIQCIMSRNNGRRTILYNNNKGVFERTNIFFPDSYNGSISTFDYNNDGFLDIFIMGPLNSTRVFKNNHGLNFEEVIMDLPQLGGGTIIPGDINNDGWIDLLIMGKNYAASQTLFHYYVFQNNDGIYSLIYRDSIQTDTFYRNDNIADFADLDNDGDLDIVIHEITDNESINGIKILINNGGIFTGGNYLVKGLGEGAITTGDFDNDGDVDILSSSEKGTSIFFNTCNNFFEKEIVKTRSWISGFWWARVDCNDFDNDGKLDFTESAPGRSIIYYSKFPQDYYVLNISNLKVIGIDTHLGDYNNDGFVDVAVSNKILRNFQGNDSFVMNTPPSIPSNLKHTINDSTVILSWNKSTDNQTPQNGLSYNLRIGTAIDKADVMSPNADLYTGKRKIVEMGNTFLNNSWTVKGLRSGTYYWSVQAIDNAFEGGYFAPISSFSIPGRIAVEPSDQDVGSEPGVATFSINSNTDWNISDNSDWLTVTPVTGSSDGTFTVTFTANTLIASRVGTITISGTDVSPKSVTITQKGIPVLSVTPSNQDVGLEAGSTTFSISSNTSWTVSDDADWLTVSPLSGNGNGTITATFIANPLAITSIGTLTISCPGISPQSVTVSQSKTTGVSTSEDIRLTVYPNPAKDFIVIKFDGSIVSDISVSVADALGKTYFSKEYKGDNSEKEKTIDITSLKRGFYFVIIKGKHTNKTCKIIKE